MLYLVHIYKSDNVTEYTVAQDACFEAAIASLREQKLYIVEALDGGSYVYTKCAFLNGVPVWPVPYE